MRTLFFILFFVLGFCHIQARGQKPAHVIITAGQSNTDGRVPNNRLPDYIKAMAVDSTYTAGAYKYCHIAHNRTDGMFVPFWPLSHPKSKPYTWGYDAIAYYWLEQLFQEDFYVIKWAIGGTAIAAPVTTPFRGTFWSADPKWLAENTATSEKGKSLLLSLIANIDASIDQTLSKLKQGYQIDAFVWHQGESDYEHGKEYYQNLKGVVAYVRNHLTEKTGKDYSELPFIFGTVSRKNKRYNSDVEEGMRRYAKEDKNAYLIDMSEAELMGDKLHFNQVSAEYMGRQVYEQIKKTLSDDPHVYVAKYKGDRACAISYTFDDGLAEHSTVAAPELEKRGFRGTFWVCGYYTEQGASAKVPRMTWDELREMSEKGHEVSSHSWAHKNAKRLTIEQVKSEIEKNDSAIYANIGIVPRTYCYPYNYKTEEIVGMASKGRVATRTKQISIGGKSTPERFDKWLKDLMKAEDWGVGMTHGINYGYDAFKSPSLFGEHLDKVKSMEDQIWVGTFCEVASYIKEREEIQLKVSNKKNGMTITPKLKLDRKLFAEPLTMVIQGETMNGIQVKQGRKELPVYMNGNKVMFDFNPYGGAIKIHFN